MKIGNDIYTILKRNNTIVWAMALVTVIVSCFSLFVIFKVYRESQQNMFAINDKGALVPLVKLDEKKDRLKQVQANMDYFVSLYYDLDGYTMKEKKEKIMWLVGNKPTEIIKDRDKKGYFNTFLSITGLVQHAEIQQNSWKISSYDAPYDVSFVVHIVRINGEAKEFYTSTITATLEEVNKNYPYNPYGLIITKLSESIKRLDPKVQKEEEQINAEAVNQNE
ncbi:hypothetical protein B0A67_24465 [Flavobacterium aquidurense]|uniref:hypothetical protein n=1 Tax=Flavobacterium aquidurense TaxID=362413 RepID=UPI0009147025|nr:hypothetical protein [Flavobacterium aquidurense]OXA65324.1 hypothetical protein B0A67_24465 [Flavobacterium aquidurense]SHH86651.1 hypothetical protein SAMN05444481_13612 [Flavobacterium frigidimaris]